MFRGSRVGRLLQLGKPIKPPDESGESRKTRSIHSSAQEQPLELASVEQVGVSGWADEGRRLRLDEIDWDTGDLDDSIALHPATS